ncbi:MAG: ATP-dependent DNA helicase DinG [Pseudomonadales bacterium]|jgi:ATP-dependent DNA helicase DinG|nr:ATP-dependent DNA helicase DinG [Pseudomonadales bacterium]MDP6471982.1 ATP-dependent DNA helicase DinG [Pseudomonadales bacterium]MDP6826747.1 ATP-dependent DNA helicase DinG [Pseudomonadales bacterium]MDP6971022.1 ATP-dependent DNA helicase DinG [Pseudomonadales bacterium]
MSALSQELKNTIQDAYRAWLQARGFRARRGQREMVAHIANTLAGDAPRIVAIEAGTGTGKTAAYCIAAIPVACALGKTMVISSATVALQEQVVLRDLPDLKARSGLKFDYALAKGRGRYLCLKRLDDRLKYADQQEIPLFESGLGNDESLYQEMLRRFAAGEWNGEYDTWNDPLEEESWRQVTTDHRGCTNNRCSYFRQCPFFKARTQLDGVDVIVANHDLVLADLSLGGGAVLPEPEECIYVIDEAHHLPGKTQQHFSVSARLRGTQQWAEQVQSVIGTLTQRFGAPPELVEIATRLAGTGTDLSARFEALFERCVDLAFEQRDETLATHRFALGRVPEDLAAAAAEALEPTGRMAADLERVHIRLQEAVDGEKNWERAFEAEDWLPVAGLLVTRVQSITALLEDYSVAAGERGHAEGRFARWVNRGDTDLHLVSAPIDPGSLIADRLWSRCFAAVCTSATLTALGRFDRFFERAGLPEVERIRIPSPFDFPRVASLTVPDMRSDPRDFDAHTEEVAVLLPGLLAQQSSGLVLFTSWRQMRAVTNALDDALIERMQIQGEAAKQALIGEHYRRIDAGEPSYLVGLASFSEGVDLPGDYCRHVVIVKLPFAVPDDPVDQAMAEWAEAEGRNAFYEISVPDAALRLVQACGRLIRHEDDSGMITVLDKRIVTHGYGRALLDSLPPYRRVLPAA